MKLGANSVLFGSFDMETAFEYTAMAGYDGIELSTMMDMSEHLVLARWRELVPTIKRLSTKYGLALLAIEKSAPDPAGVEQAFQAAVELGIPVVCCGSGGKAGDEASFRQAVDLLGNLARMAETYDVTLCIKAHVGASVHDTPTTLQLMRAVTSSALGINMDPSHIYRAGENPVEAIEAVMARVKHVHIRDCKGRQQGPGDPNMQANGRGDIDLVGYVRVLHEHGYAGALDLEIIGTKRLGYSLEQCCIIAAESRGHMQACLQACGAR